MSFPARPETPAAHPSTDRGFVLGPDDGAAWWWLGSLNLVKVDGRDSGGGVDVVDHRVPAGYAPPLHVHEGQDELFFVLAGRFEVRCGDETWTAGPGSLVFLPRGVAHGFTVSGDEPGRTLLINAPAGFADVVTELGTPADRLELPGPDVADPPLDRLAAVSAAHGIYPADDPS